MPVSTTTAKRIYIAVIENDPLRFIGLSALLESEPHFELIAAAPPEILMRSNLGAVLVGDHPRNDLASWMAHLRVMRPDLPVISIGSNTDDESIIRAISQGAKGYVSDGVSPAEIAHAIRVVTRGSIWAPRRVLSIFIERAIAQLETVMPGGTAPLSNREKEVLKMLVAGLSNKEIGAPLGITERTVKAHVARMMRKVGVQNRTALSVHAVTHSLLVDLGDQEAIPTCPQQREPHEL
jgi:DNA-binding NarL/FixJ family response regulator